MAARATTIVIGVGADTTFGAITLPTNFELLGLELTNNAAVTLSPTFTTGAGVALSGYGSVVNQASLVTAGSAVTGGFFGSSLTVTNQADIAATFSNTSQAAVDGIGYVTNTGTITGGQTGVELNYSGTLINAAGGRVSGSTNAIANTGFSAAAHWCWPAEPIRWAR